MVKLSLPAKQSVEVRVELPHLYPLLEQARVSVHTPLLGKAKEQRLKMDLVQFQSERREEDPEPYIYQLLSWLQEHIEDLMKRPASEFQSEQTSSKSCSSCSLSTDLLTGCLVLAGIIFSSIASKACLVSCTAFQ